MVSGKRGISWTAKSVEWNSRGGRWKSRFGDSSGAFDWNMWLEAGGRGRCRLPSLSRRRLFDLFRSRFPAPGEGDLFRRWNPLDSDWTRNRTFREEHPLGGLVFSETEAMAISYACSQTRYLASSSHFPPSFSRRLSIFPAPKDEITCFSFRNKRWRE